MRPRTRQDTASVASSAATVLRKRLDRVDGIRFRHGIDDGSCCVDRGNARDAPFDGGATNFDAIQYFFVCGSWSIDDAIDSSFQDDVEHVGVSAANALRHHLHRHSVAFYERRGA